MKRSGEKRRKPTLKPRQQKLLDGILAGKSTRKAAQDAGYRRGANHPSELLDTASMRRALRQHLPSVEQIGKRIREGLDARKTQLAQHEGRFHDARHMIDFHERRKFAELASRLHGLLDLDDADEMQHVTVKIVRNASIENIRDGSAFGKPHEHDADADAD